MDSASAATARWYLEGGTYRCAECASSFSSETAVETHFRTTHNNYNSHYCSQCQMNFKDSWHLKRHLFTHGIVDSETPQVRNACALCGGSFSDAWHLRQHLKTHEDGDLQAAAPRRRGRRRGRPSTAVLGHISTMEQRVPIPEWSIDTNNASSNAEDFYDNYEKLEGLRPEAREYYCGICGEGVCKNKFVSHSLLHMHDVFEVRRGKTELESVEDGECGQCQSLSRKIRAMVQVIDETINQSCSLECAVLVAILDEVVLEVN